MKQSCKIAKLIPNFPHYTFVEEGLQKCLSEIYTHVSRHVTWKILVRYKRIRYKPQYTEILASF